MNQFESNIKASFREVKTDILEIKSQILSLAESQQGIERAISKMNSKVNKSKKANKK